MEYFPFSLRSVKPSIVKARKAGGGLASQTWPSDDFGTMLDLLLLVPLSHCSRPTADMAEMHESEGQRIPKSVSTCLTRSSAPLYPSTV